MTNPVVNVSVSVIAAPTPSTLQKTGALLSQGGTNTAPGTKTLLQVAADLATVSLSALVLASLTQSAGVATATLKSTTISSGTYDTDTGIATLTLVATLNLIEGDPINLAAVTGTGAFADLDGFFDLLAGSTGTTAKVQLATGLTMTITGGNAKATHNQDNGAEFWTTIAGAAQSGYNGAVLATATGVNTFTYDVASTTVSPATGSITATPAGAGELQQMVTTFFAQGGQQGVYVLELGPGTPAEGIAYLSAWITANPGIFYSYLVPRAWADEATYLTMLDGFENTTSKTYFFTTVTVDNYTDFANSKCVVAMVEAPDLPATEFSLASAFWVTLNYKPSSTNRVTPLNLSYLFGVTAYPTDGNVSLLNTLNNAGVNVVGTGAQGGISATILIGGGNMDGNPFNYWYSIDWVQVFVPRNLNALLIAGANNPQNPIYYNQPGINALQQSCVSTMQSGISNGLVLNTVKVTTLSAADFLAALDANAFRGFTEVNADPFPSYVVENPDDYAAGVYDGIAIDYVPLIGFESVRINISVSQFAS